MMPSDFIKQNTTSIKKWAQKIQDRNYKAAKSIAVDRVKLCRRIILEDEDADEDNKNIALYYGVLFRGLEELSELTEIVAKHKWYKDLDSIERAWLLLQNCKDRLESTLILPVIPSNIVKPILSFLNTLDNDFLKLFGPGYYASPEIIIKKGVCSICKSDYRYCPHLPNHVYNGRICRMEATEIAPGNGIVLLPTPKDPRCRLWPWHTEKKGDGLLVSDVTLMTFFRIDDFLD